jgi:hypothetical protein
VPLAADDAPDDAAADDDAADDAAALVLLLVVVVLPDEQAASARPAAASPAMSFRLRARRTLFSSSFTARHPGRGTEPIDEPTDSRAGGSGIERTLPAGSRLGRGPVPLRNRIVPQNG